MLFSHRHVWCPLTSALLTCTSLLPPRPRPPQDVCARYEAMGWHVQHVQDGNHDLDGLRAAIQKAKVRAWAAAGSAWAAMAWAAAAVRGGCLHLYAFHPLCMQDVTDKPSLIKVSTLIGYGSPNKVRFTWGMALATREEGKCDCAGVARLMSLCFTKLRAFLAVADKAPTPPVALHLRPTPTMCTARPWVPPRPPPPVRP